MAGTGRRVYATLSYENIFFLSFIMFCLFVSIEEESQHGVKCSGW